MALDGMECSRRSPTQRRRFRRSCLAQVRGLLLPHPSAATAAPGRQLDVPIRRFLRDNLVLHERLPHVVHREHLQKRGQRRDHTCRFPVAEDATYRVSGQGEILGFHQIRSTANEQVIAPFDSEKTRSSTVCRVCGYAKLIIAA